MYKGAKNLKQWQIDILVKYCLFKKGLHNTVK